ncbi:hypothetical protein SAMN06265350_101207 [Solitalea koreensis]|uniref:Lipoprotein n=1 Tax=Solitalea koreensis TaxID=543615 RepID=A0A521ALH2_9SPHI|nr:hypothetical protein SAMN06265350_101207 [Solitalea koreensis]
MHTILPKFKIALVLTLAFTTLSITSCEKDKNIEELQRVQKGSISKGDKLLNAEKK